MLTSLFMIQGMTHSFTSSLHTWVRERGVNVWSTSNYSTGSRCCRMESWRVPWQMAALPCGTQQRLCRGMGMPAS